MNFHSITIACWTCSYGAIISNFGSGRIETFDFTDDIVKFTENLGKIKAERGADYPEDVLGGINATLGLSWQAANKIFFQIGNDYMDFNR